MNFICQSDAMNNLQLLANSRKHSILIEGVSGCGKTYLAMRYAEMLGVSDFQLIEPSVQNIREAVEACYQIDSPVVICIENLDKGVAAASYTLLKFLEEPAQHVYIVVTCRNIKQIPDTIISRSVCVTTSPPIDSDLVVYGNSRNQEKCSDVMQRHTKLWSCLRSFADVDNVLVMTPEQLDYFQSLSSLLSFKDTISNMMWQIGHYSDNSELPVDLAIRYLMELTNNQHIHQAGISCLSDLSLGRLASHAVVARFLLECKYCE